MSEQPNIAVLPQMADLPFGDVAWRRACEAALEQRVDDPVLLDVQRSCSAAGRWDGVYLLSVLARLETSVLIDAENRVFLDWGTAGEVTLQPPVGARAPFKLWVHTHPRFASYWSSTDTHSLALGAAVVERAMVLGQPGPKAASNARFVAVEAGPRLARDGPLGEWTEEAPVPWDDWYAQHGLLTEVNA